MKIFITGASGFIGKSLLNYLREHELMCLSRSQSIKNYGKDIKFISGDLGQPRTYIYHLEKFRPDCCIHLAWNGLPDYSIENSIMNLTAGIDLVKILVKLNCKKIFIAGSCWEYGEAQGSVSESYQPNQTGIFASFKTSLRIISESICQEADVKLIWGRAFFVYGPGQRIDSLIPTCYANMKNGDEPKINNPSVLNDFVYVNDVADSIRLLIESEDSEGIYNIGSGTGVAVWEVVNYVAHELGFPRPYSDMPRILPGNFADLSKIRKLKWNPKIDLTKGIALTIESLKDIK